MHNANIEKWIYGIRKTMNENGLDDSEVSDEECLDIIFGLMVPQLPETTRLSYANIDNVELRRIAFKSLLSLVKPEGEMFEGIDMELLRIRLNEN